MFSLGQLFAFRIIFQAELSDYESLKLGSVKKKLI